MYIWVVAYIGMAHHGLNRVNIDSIPTEDGRRRSDAAYEALYPPEYRPFSIKFNNLPKALAAHGAAAAVGKQPFTLLALQQTGTPAFPYNSPWPCLATFPKGIMRSFMFIPARDKPTARLMSSTF